MKIILCSLLALIPVLASAEPMGAKELAWGAHYTAYHVNKMIEPIDTSHGQEVWVNDFGYSSLSFCMLDQTHFGATNYSIYSLGSTVQAVGTPALQKSYLRVLDAAKALAALARRECPTYGPITRQALLNQPIYQPARTSSPEAKEFLAAILAFKAMINQVTGQNFSMDISKI